MSSSSHKKEIAPDELRDAKKKARKLVFQKRHALVRNRTDWSTIVNFRGCRFFASPSNKIESVLLQENDAYDANNFTAIDRLVKPGFVCFDIGANIGVYSVTFANLSANPAGVHAFEPVDHIRNKLKLNAKLNGFAGIQLNDFALGATEETIDMNQIREGVFRGGTSSFLQNENWDSLSADDFEIRPVRVQRLDDYVQDRKLNRVDFLKIDVEGFEWNVLQGGQETLARFKPYILMEYDFKRHNEGQNPAAYKSLFDALGYRAFEFTLGGGELFLLPYAFDQTPLGRNILCLHPDFTQE